MFAQALARLALRLGGMTLVFAGFAVDPTIVRAGILDASWTAPTTNVDSTPLTDLGSYRLYYATSASPCPGGSYVTVASPTPNPAAGQTVAARLTGLVAGTQYYAAVTAVDTSGNQSGCLAEQAALARIDFAVTPVTTTSFGSVVVGGVVDRTFTVQNTGGGTITGTVVTSAPFSVVSGSSFSLTGAGTTHVATVRFRPTVAATATVNVSFTTASGDRISRVVTGTGTAVSTGDTTPPTIAITGPTAGATYGTTSLSVALSGSATDDVGVSAVTWASSRGGSGTATGTTTWTAPGIVLLEGSNVLTVTARDAAGNTATDTVTVTVSVSAETTPPTVSVTAPASGSTVSGTVTLSASAADNVGVAGVQFQVDGVDLGAEDSVAPYTMAWNTTTAALGAHELTAVARDAAGNTTTSAVVTVTVGSVSTAALLTNGSFEAFTASVATGWTLVTDGVASVRTSKAAGLTGSGQKIDITTAGTWGFYVYQTPKLRLNQTYEWTFSYKTSGANGMWAQISDPIASHVVLSEELPGTNGTWTQRTLTFTYTDGAANLLRINSNGVGSIWLDAFSLREIDAPLLVNGSFDSFSGKLATGWKLARDGAVSATTAKATALSGLGQRITITAPGTWGLYLHQQVVLKLGATYEWTFSYKTSGANTVWAQMTNAAVSSVVLSHELPGTNGAWAQQTVTFTYTDARADLLRMSSNEVGTLWLDAFSLREVDAPIVSNQDLEFFSGNVATRWRVATDGVVAATFARVTGHSGFGQRMTITSPGVWGAYFHQQVVLKLDERYEWTFWYKTSGANTVWAQLTDSTASRVVLSRELPGTNGTWRQQSLAFTYTNARADLLRIISNAVGSVTLDEFSVRETAP
jgi:hypothetical protein